MSEKKNAKVVRRRYRDDADYARSYAAFIREDYAGAARILESLVGKRPDDVSICNDLGVCFFLSDHPQEARGALERALQAGGRKASAGVNLRYLVSPGGVFPGGEGINGHRYALPGGAAPSSEETVSIIILEYNNPKLTLESLRSLKRFRPGVPFEVILIDNSDRGPSPDFQALAGLPELKVHRSDRNLGFAGGCNKGAELARGEFLHFVNNDTLFQDRCVEELVRVLANDPRVGIAGSRLLYDDGTVQHAGIVFSHLSGSPEHRCRYSPAHDPRVNIPLDMQAVTGASLMIRRELFKRLGGFSEEFVNGYEDLDLCLRAAGAGSRVVYNPLSVLYHLESMSPERTLHEEANLQRFEKIWGGRLRRDQVEYLSPCDNFLLSYTDNPDRDRRRRQVLGLSLYLLRRHPELTVLLPLHCIEFYKHYRFQRFARHLFAYLMDQDQILAARDLFHYFLLRGGFRVRHVGEMRNLLKQKTKRDAP